MKISVALCTYNGEKYIREQLNSIINQTINVNKIIICDDNSTDITWNILEEYKIKYPKLFKLYKNKKALGVTKNFEEAINFCDNGIVFLSDQDDIWFPNKVEKIIKYFNDNPYDFAVFHNLQLYKDNHPQKLTQWDTISFDQEYRKKENLFLHLLLFNNVVTGAALVFKKTSSVNFSCSKYLHDYILALDYSSISQLGILEENLGYYRIHDQQQVGTNLEKTNYQKLVTQWQSDFYEEYNLSEKLKIINRSITKITFLKDINTDLYLKANLELKNILIDTRDKYLKTLSLLQRKKTLLSWLKDNKNFVTISDFFLK